VMTSRFFRSASSSSSSSESEASENDELPSEQTDNSAEVLLPANTTESLPGRTTVEQHRTNLINALLEDVLRTRAAEALNQRAEGGQHFDRSSPEVQVLTQQLFTQASISLAAAGIISPAQEGDDNPRLRTAYLSGVEALAAEATSNNTILAASTGTRRGHYESSFQQLKLLGKGGFGMVYRAFNNFDQREYAVKKIPLSPRLSRRYRESGLEELNNVLREVQVLSQLEHSNIIRYHSTWIEEPRQPSRGSPVSFTTPLLSGSRQRMITDHQAVVLPQDPGRYVVTEIIDNGGISFDLDSQQVPAPIVETDAHVSTHNDAETEPEMSSVRPSEIFTDGFGRSNVLSSTALDDSVYVLHVQMSLYPSTLAQYLAPTSTTGRTSPIASVRRHCFHLVPALRLLLGILCGLQYLHAKGLVHRDLKPSNIFITSLDITTETLIPEGYHDVGSCASCPELSPLFVNPRIGDFGLVSALVNEEYSGIESRGSGVVGTEFYRPPMWHGAGSRKAPARIDEKLDVFALGVILIELLWPCSTSIERMHVLKDAQGGYPPMGLFDKLAAEGHAQGISDLVVTCVKRMIEPNPDQRHGCTEVKDTIESVLRSCDRGSPIDLVEHPNDPGEDTEDIRVAQSLEETMQLKQPQKED
jgi:eukaryotic translation initiation factor 2-alpha kinase 3